MKKIIVFILAFICICTCVFAENEATPTDLVEFEDDDWGEITITFERQVYIDGPEGPFTMGDELTFTAILVNFKPEDIVQFFWQYAVDHNLDWQYIEGENEQTYTFILTADNSGYYYRVIVKWEDNDEEDNSNSNSLSTDIWRSCSYIGK